jgi:predicted membrane-bound dolichyl-phosphate-mannose-protein mannosyltransferase
MRKYPGTDHNFSWAISTQIVVCPLITWSKAVEGMSRQRIMAFVCHVVACLLFPLATTIGLQVYTALFGATFASGAAIGLAVQLIFIAFVLANGLIALTTNAKAKIALTGVLVIANLAYLLPQHPLHALFFAGLSGVLTLAAYLRGDTTVS